MSEQWAALSGSALSGQAGSAPSVTEIVAAASAALGRPLTEPAELPGGGDWSVVLRCRDATGGTVIVKTYPPTAEGTSSFAAEAAGLELTGGSELAPEFLAADAARQVVVMADLGEGRSLADALLADPPDSAAAAGSVLVDWAAACGRLAVAASPRQRDFDRLTLSYLAGRPDARHATGLRDRVLGAASQAAKIVVSAPAGLDAELALVAAAVESDEFAVFSPGDICPDNNVLTPAGIRFIDFEESGFHSVFLNAAYIRMPFSTVLVRVPVPGRASRRGRGRLPDAGLRRLARPGRRRSVAAGRTTRGRRLDAVVDVMAAAPCDGCRRPDESGCRLPAHPSAHALPVVRAGR